MQKYIFCVIFIVCSVIAQAQHEHIEYLPHTSQKSLLKSTSDFTPTRLLTLPFFDDFAYPQTTPAIQLWTDNFAFVNTSFAYNPPTIGVLTLDALDNNGNLYPQASSNVFTADYATSQPINLFDYRKVFASNELYIKNGATFELFEKDTYYLYEHSLRNFVDVVKGIPYYAGDTIYTKTSTGFEPVEITVYDESKNLIPESLDNSRTWIPYSTDDNIILSFYYQAGGNADNPEAQDSLVLEYYTPFARQGVFINEITQQWVEIFNATDTVVSLSGYYLVADTLETMPVQKMAQWQIPEISYLAPTIAPYSHAIVSAGDFGIDNFTSSQYYLLSPTLNVVDSTFLDSEISAETSYARLPDGNPEWSFSVIETPAQPNDTWHTLWNTSAGKLQNEEFAFDTVFFSHQIPLDAIEYLQKGFRFRFKNYASLSNDASHARNEDFWHLDMVWIDANREENKPDIADVAFSTPIIPLFNRYTALPKSHFSQLTEDDFRMAAESTFRNFDIISRKIKFHFAVRNSHNSETVSFPSFETDLNPFQIVSDRDILTDHDVEFFGYMTDESAAVDSIDFEFQYFFTDNNNPLFEQYRWNDTNRVNLTLSNYYAYDDGTPEAGYGLRNAPMGQVAFKFDILQPDTLRAIQMYFNPTLDQEPKTFNLCVWAVGEKNMPGELLYRRTSTRVQYADGLYNFVTYPIEDEAIETDDTGGIYIENSFFVGWEQPQDVLLNVGMDLSNQMRNRLYFNASYQWEASVTQGALLIRPQFGKSVATGISTISEKNCTLYPTIVQSQAYVQSDEEIVRCEFTDITGKTVQQLPVIGNSIDCTSIPNGFYLVKLYGNNNFVTVKKCIVRK